MIRKEVLTDRTKQLNESELNEIRLYLREHVFSNPDFFYPSDIYDTTVLEDAIKIIACLFELLHIEICDDTYDYFWHFSNKITGTIPFKTGDFIDMVNEEVHNE